MQKQYAASRPFLCIFLCCLAASVALSAPPRIVSGTVTDAAGTPITKGYVAAVSVNANGTAGQIPWTPIDASGNFRLFLPPGTHTIRAKDEADGYPDPSYLLSRDPAALFPTIVVGTNDLTGVQVRLGEQGGVLDGTVVERETQTPIHGSRVIVRSALDSTAFVEITPDNEGVFQFSVPAKPLVVCAGAPERSTVCFENAEPITVSGGAHFLVKLQLGGLRR